MSQIDDFFDGVKTGIIDIARDFIAGAKQAGIDDMKAYALGRKADVERWAGQLASGQISPADFEFLVKGMKDAAEIRLLRIAGVQAAQLQRARDALVNLVIDTAIGRFVPGVRGAA